MADNKGQVGIVMILIMSVLMTVGLSLAANANRDLSLSQSEEESNRVFNAAEAGIEQALSQDGSFDSSFSDSFSIDNADVNFSIDKTSSLETRVFEGVSIHIDVVGATASNLVVDWARENDCASENPASLMITAFYEENGVSRARYYLAGACDEGSYDRDHGAELASVIDIDGYRRRFSVPIEADDLFFRIKPLYNDTHIRVAGGGGSIPTQGYAIRSEAKNQNGDETRIVQVNRSLPAAPSVMDYALFSGTTLTK